MSYADDINNAQLNECVENNRTLRTALELERQHSERLQRELTKAKADVARWEASAAKWATERIEKHGTEPPASELADMRFMLAQAIKERDEARAGEDETQRILDRYVEITDEVAEALGLRTSKSEGLVRDSKHDLGKKVSDLVVNTRNALAVLFSAHDKLTHVYVECDIERRQLKVMLDSQKGGGA